MCKQVYMIYQCGHDELPKFYNCFDRPCQGVVRVIIKESNLSLCPRCSAIVIFGKSVYWISSILTQKCCDMTCMCVILLISKNWAVENHKKQNRKRPIFFFFFVLHCRSRKKTLCVVHRSWLKKKKRLWRLINFETLFFFLLFFYWIKALLSLTTDWTLDNDCAFWHFY